MTPPLVAHPSLQAAANQSESPESSHLSIASLHEHPRNRIHIFVSDGAYLLYYAMARSPALVICPCPPWPSRISKGATSQYRDRETEQIVYKRVPGGSKHDRAPALVQQICEARFGHVVDISTLRCAEPRPRTNTAFSSKHQLRIQLSQFAGPSRKIHRFACQMDSVARSSTAARGDCRPEPHRVPLDSITPSGNDSRTPLEAHRAPFMSEVMNRYSIMSGRI